MTRCLQPTGEAHDDSLPCPNGLSEVHSELVLELYGSLRTGRRAQSVDVPCVILGKVYPRQGPVIADESLEASTALHEHGVAQPSCVNEMLMTVNDREPLTFHDGGALLLVNEARHGVLLQSRG